jgi:glucose-1-phosphate thymidylyltransferase
MLSSLIKESFLNPKGANIYLYPSKNTSAYGVVELGKNGTIKKIIEKPKFTRSNLVITGMYVFDKNVSLYAKKLKPSKRGDTEIVYLINLYKKKKLLNIIKLGRGSAWLDVGSFEDLQNGSNFIQNIEQRQNYMIGCLEEISLNNKWINKKNLMNRIKFFGNSNYARYLKDLLKY